MADLTQKIRKLLALADPNRNGNSSERSNAAVAAVNMILAYGLDVIDPKAAPLPTPGPPAGKPAPAPPPPHHARPPRPPQPFAREGWIEITSRYDGRCRHCWQEYEVGDVIAWMKGYGATHIECADLHAWP